MAEIDEGLGAQLRAHRQAAGLSQEELAERSGLSVRTIRNLECGRARWPYRATLYRLADGLNLPDTVRTAFTAAPSLRLAPGLGTGRIALTAARQLGDLCGQGRANCQIGSSYRGLG